MIKISWKDILKDGRMLDKDPPMEYQPDYDNRPIERQQPHESLYDTLRRHGFPESSINEIKRMKELEEDEEKFYRVLDELDELAESFGHREALRQIGEPDNEIFYNLGYHTREGREQIKEHGIIMLTNEIVEALEG